MMNPTSDPSPLQMLALARLLAAGEKGETEKNLSKDLLAVVDHRRDGQAWADRLGAALDELESAGTFHRIKAGKGMRLSLTDQGRRLASESLGIEGPPAKLTWAKLKSTHLPALALGRPGPSAINLKVEILRSQYDLDLGDGQPSLTKATDQLAAKLLGLEAGRKFDANSILRKLLLDAGIEVPPGPKPPAAKAIAEALFRRELGDRSAKKPLELLATRSVGARQASASELVAAVLRSWVDRSKSTPAGTVPASSPPEPQDRLALPAFARRVVEAARTSPSGWFGHAKVFISHAWRAIEDDPEFGEMDLATFKHRLLEAHRARFLELGRADLVEAMDPADVRESATPYENVVYHFVRTEEPAR